MNAGFALDTRFGANPRNDGSTRFRLWAPGQETVSVAVELKIVPEASVTATT